METDDGIRVELRVHRPTHRGREPDIHHQLGQLGEQEIALLRRQVLASRQAIELAALDPLQAFASLEAKLAQDERMLQAESQQVPVPLALYPILGFTKMS